MGFSADISGIAELICAIHKEDVYVVFGPSLGRVWRFMFGKHLCSCDKSASQKYWASQDYRESKQRETELTDKTIESIVRPTVFSKHTVQGAQVSFSRSGPDLV